MKPLDDVNNQKFLSVPVPEAFAMIRRAGGLFEIGHAGLTIRRTTRPGEFAWVRLLAYSDSLGSLVNLAELEAICRQLPRKMR